MAALLDRGIDPHVPLLAKEEEEELPTWKLRALDLERARAREQKVKEVRARNRVREIHKTREYTISRKLRIRSEHLLAEAKNEHGLGRARRRGLERVDDQCTLRAVVQNLKRLVALMSRKGRGAAAALSQAPSGTSLKRRLGHLRRNRGYVRHPGIGWACGTAFVETAESIAGPLVSGVMRTRTFTSSTALGASEGLASPTQ